LRITGICSLQIDFQKSVREGGGTVVPTSLRVLVDSPAEIIVIQKASWWTPMHALIILAIIFLVTLAVLGWVMTLRMRVEQQALMLRKQAEQLFESEERYKHMALHDALTGLPTRVLLRDRLEMVLAGEPRSLKKIAVMMVDIDRFKAINDHYGHAIGDQVLRATAQRISDTVRASDTVARMGGDEFVVLLPDLHNANEAEGIAAKIVKALSLPIMVDGQQLPSSVSAGVCIVNKTEADSTSILNAADKAMYEAKARGRNCYQISLLSELDVTK
jgi:diguanylate cyclase (GGDEF)-like protein